MRNSNMFTPETVAQEGSVVVTACYACAEVLVDIFLRFSGHPIPQASQLERSSYMLLNCIVYLSKKLIG